MCTGKALPSRVVACLMPLPLTRHILTAGACTHPSCPHVGLLADFAAACRPSLVQTMQQRAQQLSPPSPGNGPAQLSGFGEQALVDWLSCLHLDAEVRWFPCPHTPPLVAMEHVGANANAKLPPSLCPGNRPVQSHAVHIRQTCSAHWSPRIAHHAHADSAGAGA